MFSLKHYKSFSFVAVWHQFVWYCELADACPKRYITRPLATLLSLTVSNINFFPHFFFYRGFFFSYYSVGALGAAAVGETSL